MSSSATIHRLRLTNACIGVFACWHLIGLAEAQPPSSETPEHSGSAIQVVDDDADGRARLLGMLMYRKVTIDFEGIAAEVALTEIERQAQLPLIARWVGGPAHPGMDPQARVSALMQDVSALEALEAVLACISAAPMHEECTWQLRRGFIEVGTKSRLGVPAARDRRVYDITDMLIEPPTFSSDDSPLVRAFRKGLNHDAPDAKARPDDQGSMRRTPQAIAVDVIQEICETIEPGHWDFGQPLSRELDGDRLVPLPEGGAGSTNKNAASAPARNVNATDSKSGMSTSLPVSSIADAWASIRLWRTQLIVTAPDFMHRQLGGYPAPIAPTDAESALLRKENHDS